MTLHLQSSPHFFCYLFPPVRLQHVLRPKRKQMLPQEYMEVKRPALLGNHDRPTNQPTDRTTNQPTRRTDTDRGSQGSFNSNKSIHISESSLVRFDLSLRYKDAFKSVKDLQGCGKNYRGTEGRVRLQGCLQLITGSPHPVFLSKTITLISSKPDGMENRLNSI